MLKTLIFLFLIGFLPAEAKEWRGIVPMKSTRADVTRILGNSPDANHIRANYDLDEGRIYIVFSTEDAYYDCVPKLPPDTVLLIKFTPKRPLGLSDLKFDLSNFKKFDPSEPKNIGYEGHLNEEEGLTVVSYKGQVLEINYIATPKDQESCPEYYRHPEKFGRRVMG